MKPLLFLLLAPLFGWGQSKPDSTIWIQVTVTVDTTYGYILAQTCEQCQAIYRPVISVRNVNKVRYWRRQWVFGKIQYYYKPIPERWKVIDYKRSEKW